MPEALTPINCEHCGAPLDVPDSVSRVTCIHCGTRLRVERGGSVAFTREIKALDSRADALEQRMARLESHVIGRRQNRKQLGPATPEVKFYPIYLFLPLGVLILAMFGGIVYGMVTYFSR